MPQDIKIWYSVLLSHQPCSPKYSNSVLSIVIPPSMFSKIFKFCTQCWYTTIYVLQNIQIQYSVLLYRHLCSPKNIKIRYSVLLYHHLSPKYSNSVLSVGISPSMFSKIFKFCTQCWYTTIYVLQNIQIQYLVLLYRRLCSPKNIKIRYSVLLYHHLSPKYSNSVLNVGIPPSMFSKIFKCSTQYCYTIIYVLQNTQIQYWSIVIPPSMFSKIFKFGPRYCNITIYVLQNIHKRHGVRT